MNLEVVGCFFFPSLSSHCAPENCTLPTPPHPPLGPQTLLAVAGSHMGAEPQQVISHDILFLPSLACP